ncbi:spore germination protein [Cytobacillus sp. S13-E01]|uniref:spore germination protein n=1 Tax=Cytobacillus sp. S13-E01 TaxID=3031326 RepID=UPI0023D828FE|nr:spore germination protein [Cytobacillus sp. S13-E01]MDF0728154.1 spore germination protein [Cytobacillus sp. S13-E01]
MNLFSQFYKSLFTKQIKNDGVTPKEDKLQESVQKPSLQHTISEFKDCGDLDHHTLPHLQVDLLFFRHLLDEQRFLKTVLEPINHVKIEELPQLLKESQYKLTENTKELILGILNGRVAIFFQEKAYLIDVYKPATRNITQSETETVITGPHDAFTESLDPNLSLLRKRVKSSHLKVIKLLVGEVTKTTVLLLYIKDLANMDLVKELQDRIENIEIDAIYDSNMLVQIIEENPNSIFPQFLTTERPDSVASKLVSGRIVGFVDGSPSAFVAPTGFFEFFGSPDDYYQRWWLGSFVRILRFFAFIITTLFTAFYVSVTTFHYEMIPDTLLLSLAESRSKVPFPPIYEALLMEITIELLREAGARLPTKIGQTIGIVGGIVIGQAAVQAGLTSNILIIAVAISAIASFVIPSYIMSASIRLIRFGLIILAGIYGNFGLMIGVTLVIIHLVGITNLGTSYLTPVSPIYKADWIDTFIRAPFWMMRDRPSLSKSPNKVKNRMKK